MGITIPSKSVFNAIFVIFIILLASFGAMLWWAMTNQPQPIDYVEIREYEGQDLSSINAFRENSIKGPQYIDTENYSLTVTGLVNNEQNYTYDQVVNGYPSYKKVVTLHCVRVGA